MCVIISKRTQAKLDPAIAARAITFNPHGFGILMTDTGEVHKTMNLAEASNWLTSERPYVFHARLRTAGKISMDNVQPIMINEKAQLFHNGTVQTPRTWDKTCSDSRFVAETLRSTPGHAWRNILSMTDSRFLWTYKKDNVIKTMISGFWHKRNGIYYSKDNVLKGELVAVYGTLRSGYGNHGRMHESVLLDSGQTTEKYRMTCQGIPFVLSGEHEQGDHLKVEVYNVPEHRMADIDALEGHPNWYERRKVPITLDCGVQTEAWLYFNDEYDDGAYYRDFADYRQPDRPRSYNEEIPSIFDDDFMYDENEQKWFNLSTGEYFDTDPNQLDLFDGKSTT